MKRFMSMLVTTIGIIMVVTSLSQFFPIAQSRYCESGPLTETYGRDISSYHITTTCDGAIAQDASAYINMPNNIVHIRSSAFISKDRMNRLLLHEAAHAVENEADDATVKSLYAPLGITDPGPGTQSTDMDVWKKDPHEVLAESVVYCIAGKRHYQDVGMEYIPKDRCSELVKTFDQSITSHRP